MLYLYSYLTLHPSVCDSSIFRDGTLEILMISDFSKFCPWSLTGLKKDDIVFLFLHKTLQIVLKPPDSILCYNLSVSAVVVMLEPLYNYSRITVMREKGKVKYW